MPKTKRIFSLPTETRQQRYLKKKVGALTIRYQQRWGEELVDNLKTVIKLKGGPNFITVRWQFQAMPIIKYASQRNFISLNSNCFLSLLLSFDNTALQNSIFFITYPLRYIVCYIKANFENSRFYHHPEKHRFSNIYASFFFFFFANTLLGVQNS